MPGPIGRRAGRARSGAVTAAVALAVGAGAVALWGPWPAAASAMVVVHVGYLAYQLLGGLLSLLDRRWLIPHVASLVWAVTVVALQLRCPLTMAEKGLWQLGGVEPYTGSFLDHYLFGRLLPDGSQTVTYAGYLLVAIGSYVWLAWRAVHLRSPDRPPRPHVASP